MGSHDGGGIIRYLAVLLIPLLVGWSSVIDDLSLDRVWCGNDTIEWVHRTAPDADLECAIARADPGYVLHAVTNAVTTGGGTWRTEWEYNHGRAQRAYTAIDSLVGVMMWPVDGTTVFILMIRIVVVMPDEPTD